MLAPGTFSHLRVVSFNPSTCSRPIHIPVGPRYGASVLPWGFRRSLRIAGPLRLNLSKSGLGLSLGVPGLHIGTGPRGRYVRAGVPGTGVYYRKSLNSPRPVHVRQPTKAEQESGWMRAV